MPREESLAIPIFFSKNKIPSTNLFGLENARLTSCSIPSISRSTPLYPETMTMTTMRIMTQKRRPIESASSTWFYSKNCLISPRQRIDRAYPFLPLFGDPLSRVDPVAEIHPERRCCLSDCRVSSRAERAAPVTFSVSNRWIIKLSDRRLSRARVIRHIDGSQSASRDTSTLGPSRSAPSRAPCRCCARSIRCTT